MVTVLWLTTRPALVPRIPDRKQRLVVGGGRKTGEPGEKPLELGQEPTTNSIIIIMAGLGNNNNKYDGRSGESNPGHIGGKQVLSPLHYPCPLKNYY